MNPRIRELCDCKVKENSMTPEEKAKLDYQSALEFSKREFPDARPHAAACGVLQHKLAKAYSREDYLEEELAKARATVSALHAYHGDTEEVLYQQLRPHGLIPAIALDDQYVVTRAHGGEVFRGSEAEALVWAKSVDLDEVEA